VRRAGDEGDGRQGQPAGGAAAGAGETRHRVRSVEIAELLGILRSVAVYRLRPLHHAGLVRLYRPFVPAGGLAFDIGAHVGDRVRAFRTLGARVVAVEPGSAAMRVLRLLHGRDARVLLVAAAAGAAEGEADLRINSRNPTVPTS